MINWIWNPINLAPIINTNVVQPNRPVMMFKNSSKPNYWPSKDYHHLTLYKSWNSIKTTKTQNCFGLRISESEFQKSETENQFQRDHWKKMQFTVLLLMTTGTLGLPNRLNPFLPIHDLFSAAQINKLNSIVDRKFSDYFAFSTQK